MFAGGLQRLGLHDGLESSTGNELIRLAVKDFFRERPALRARVAFHGYWEGSFSLAEAADPAGLSVEQFTTFVWNGYQAKDCEEVRWLVQVFTDPWKQKAVLCLSEGQRATLIRLLERDFLIPREMSFENSLEDDLHLLRNVGLVRVLEHNGLLRYQVDAH